MTQIKRFALCAATALALGLPGVTAAASDNPGEPIIEFKTKLYDPEAPVSFHFTIGATEETFIQLDYGYGMVEEEVGMAIFDDDTGSINGTTISCQASPEETVRIWGDASLIDYLDLEGCYITNLDISKLTELQILNLTHNYLEGLDLTPQTKLQALYIDDNPFSTTPVIVGANKPELAILSMSLTENVDPSFDITSYPELRSLTAFSSPTLTHLDPTNCPNLLQLSIDNTNVSTLDISKNPYLMILNVANTKVSSLDLSGNPNLRELYCNHDGRYNTEYKFSTLDLSKVTQLTRLFCAGNALTELDLSALPNLTDLSCAHNQLPAIDFSGNPNLLNVNITMNNMDFVTIPADRPTFNEYYYEQNPFPVDLKYAVGTTLDFSSRVNRPGSTTSAALYAFSEEQPSSPTLLEDSYYKWENGKITFLEAYPDSVYVAFKNTALPDAILNTSKFLVKTVENFDKPSPVASLSFSPVVREYKLSVGIAGATPESPRSFSVDFGNGTLVEFQATGNELPSEPNAIGTRPTGGRGNITIYIPDGEQLTALGVANQRLLSCDLSAARALNYLSLTGCSLPSIDLSYNSRLINLDLSNNSLTELSLLAVNGRYYKYQLTDFNASHNKIALLDFDNMNNVRTVNLSYNNFDEIALEKVAGIENLDLSNNNLSMIDLRNLEGIKNLNFSNNHISEVIIQDYLPLEKLDLSKNDFTFASLPPVGRVPEYIYAPQNEIILPDKAPIVSLANYLFDKDGEQTVFAWHMASDNSPVTDNSIREKDGRFFFDNPDLGVVYCTMSHPAFPEFTGADIMRTTDVMTAPMPTEIFATFTPAEDGVAGLSIAGKSNGTTVYVDWTGLGDFEQLILKDTYTIFQGNVLAGHQGKFYSYDENNNVTVFSLEAGKLTQLDGSKMKTLKSFMCYNSGLDVKEIKLPTESPLEELTLSYCQFENTDFLNQFSGTLKMFGSDGSTFKETPDFTSLPELQVLVLSSCGLSDIKINNPKLWNLLLPGNAFRSFHIENAPRLEQLTLFNNLLESVDFSNLGKLRVVYLSYNNLTFETLPAPSTNWVVYQYSPQYPIEIEAIDGKVDLSSQTEVNGEPTIFRWFIDTPYLDENGELVGEELEEGYEYTIENGVTTFLTGNDNIMCVMTNALFPDLYITTNFIDVTVSGIENVSAEDSSAPVEYYNLQGVRVAKPASGIFIRKQGDAATKVFIR